MSYDPDEFIRIYLRDLDSALGDLPRNRRREVVEEIANHIAEERSEHPIETRAELLSMLERIGDPAEIAAEARDRSATVHSSWHEILALILLLVGGFFVIGWFVGLVLLWTSVLWSTRDKLIGTFVFPFGLALPFVVLTFALTTTTDRTTCISHAQPGPQGNVLPASNCDHGTSLLGWIIGVIGVAASVAIVLAPIATTIYLARRMNRRKLALAGA